MNSDRNVKFQNFHFIKTCSHSYRIIMIKGTFMYARVGICRLINVNCVTHLLHYNKIIYGKVSEI